MNTISILLPSYNNVCIELVESLYKQASAINDNRFAFEIIVADDGSNDDYCIKRNSEINNIPHCRFIRREKNAGRAAIRNFLATQATLDYCLFIDSDRKIQKSDFVESYARLDNVSVACGGLQICGDATELRHNIRYRMEKKYETLNTAEYRSRRPYEHFNTSNFFVRRNIILNIPFDERFRKYGYEDVFWGKNLKHNNIPILHINNPIVLDDFETNPQFVDKIEEGMHTLHCFNNELEGYSPIISISNLLRKWHLRQLLALAFLPFKSCIRRNLVGKHPIIQLFNVYKLGIFINLFRN